MQEWTGTAVGLMHIHGITQGQVGDKMGVTGDYINMILNCKKTPKNAKERVMTAINEIIKERGD